MLRLIDTRDGIFVKTFEKSLPSIQFQMHYKMHRGVIQSDGQRVKCFMKYRGGKIKCFKKKYSEYDGGLETGLWNLKTSCRNMTLSNL